MNPQVGETVLGSPDGATALRTGDRGRLRRHAPAARRALAFLIAVLAPAVAMLVEIDLMPVLDGRPTALPTVAAIVIAAWIGGPGPGLLATVLAVILETAGVAAERGQLADVTSADRLTIAILAGTGLLVDGLAAVRARAERRSVAASREAEQLLDRANTAARRLEALERLATDLADGETTDDMLQAVVQRGAVALRADQALVGVPAEGGAGLRIVAALAAGGRTDAVVLGDLGPLLLTVAQTGRAHFDDGLPASGHRPGPAVAAVSIQLPSGPGVLAFIWDRAHALAADRRAFIAALARVGTAALDRHRMFTAEVAALRRAEAATGFLNVLADAGRTLGATFDYEDLVRVLPKIAIPQLGDLGMLDLDEPDGPRRLVFTHDRALQAAGAELEQHPLPISRMGRGAAMLELGHAVAHRLDAETIAQLAETPHDGAALQDLAPGWMLQLPLAVQGTTCGVLTFIRHADRPFELAELNVGEELGRRAGRALENARLHRRVEELAELDRRRAAEMETVLGAVGEGFLLVDEAKGVIRAANRAATGLIGESVVTLDGLLNQFLDSAGNGLKALPERPAEVRLRDRPNAWVEVSAYRVEPSSGLGEATVVVACRDVTAFRRGQALRETFLSLLSHELRTPVTTIYAAAAVLTRPGRTLKPELAAEILADVAAEANRLYRLVEDLMVLAKFDEGIELGSQPVLLQHLVPAVVGSETGRWPAVEFSWQAAPNLATVGGDETAIAQVVRNLLSNAAKYSPAGGRVEVAIRGVSDGVEVAVRDEGPGLGPGEAEKVFDPFYRSPSTAGLASGAGIGLYVSRRLVEAMGGRIAANSPDGGGSEFAFVLPRHSDARAHADEAA